MAAENVFDWTCEALETATTLSRLEARGTVRLAVQAGGLQVAGLDSHQMKAILTKILPEELSLRGIPDAEHLCRDLAQRLEGRGFTSETGETAETPESVFARMGERRGTRG